MPVYDYNGVLPQLGPGTYLAPDAVVIGDVRTGSDVSFWFKTVTRGDVNSIAIGDETNVQDGSVLHVTHETHPLVVGRRVIVGHHVVLHGCTIGDGALIGIGSRVLDGAVVEPGAQVGAGAVVAPDSVVPSGFLALGVPARVVRELSDREKKRMGEICDRYLDVKRIYEEGVGEAREEEE